MGAEEMSTTGTATVYEPPRLYVIGPVTEFTFGSGGGGIDGNSTHTRQSDVRLKRNIAPVGDALVKLRSI